MIIPKLGKPAVSASAAKPMAKPHLSSTPFFALMRAKARPPEPHVTPSRLSIERPKERARTEEPTESRVEPDRAGGESASAKEGHETIDPEVAPLLDPMARLLAPPSLPIPSPAAVPEHAAAVTTHALAPELLDQAAFWGDGSRGVARLRFGSRAKGGLAGATVTLEHDGEALSLRIEGDTEVAAMLRERLARKGLPIAD
ncbi:MAG: hypothetical protein ACXVEE_12480 [Polyangiales bacterium]